MSTPTPAPKLCSCGQPRQKPWHLACLSCWQLVPWALQDKVYRLYKQEQGSEAHLSAVRECHEAIRRGRAKKEAPPPTADTSFQAGDRVRWMHEDNTSGRVLHQREGTFLYAEGAAAFVRDAITHKKVKMALNRLRPVKPITVNLPTPAAHES